MNVFFSNPRDNVCGLNMKRSSFLFPTILMTTSITVEILSSTEINKTKEFFHQKSNDQKILNTEKLSRLIM